MKRFCLLCLCCFGWVYGNDQLLLVRMVNNTNFSDAVVYVTIVGYNEPAVLDTPKSPRVQGFMQFAAPTTGIGSFIGASVDTAGSSYSYPLASFPLDETTPHCYQVQIPYIDQGQIYFSLGNKLQLKVVPGSSSMVIQNPLPCDLNDPNYPIIYDKCEFSFEPPNVFPAPGSSMLNQVTANVAAVDYFSIPMRLTLTGSSPASTGMQNPRDVIIDNIKQRFSEVGGRKLFWNSLILTSGDDFLRILSPGSGLRCSVHKYFDDEYLEGWLNTVWHNLQKSAFYQKNVLTVKTITAGKTYYGGVNFQTEAFEFWESSDQQGTPAIVIPRPSKEVATKMIFAGEMWPAVTPEGSSDATEISRLIQLGIITGFLPGTAILSAENLKAATPLYTDNPNLPPGLQSIDLYSAGIYPFGNGIFTSVLDDILYPATTLSIATWNPTTTLQIDLGGLK